ncbi:hypothetical protein B0T14DRAFT_483348 [Immersiella caudata]|uniref:Cytochrome c domain-containing protein n=1 Tax=Immersiella caudata TaxID=314043 RepID=A0AA39WK47_9PEZI|nr:hypothetical protein B0T14DRAFT_483348 [Immersiella caudata]
MANFFSRIASKRVLGGVAAGGVGVGTVAQQFSTQKQATILKDADAEFNKGYGYFDVVKLPAGFAPFQLKNNYPKPEDISAASSSASGLPPVPLPGPDLPTPSLDPRKDAPWLNVDFRTDPMRYCQIIKAYCWEGNSNNNFNIHKNTVRPWYHAPWMHWSENGREPINGLTFERVTPAGELSKNQQRRTQAWAIGFYNWIGATVFGDIWRDPSHPKWDKHVVFPLGTCVFKILMTEATEEEVACLKNAPTLQAVIATPESAANNNAGKRKDKAEPVRLLQVDFAVRDDRIKDPAQGNGWVFGTFMYNGNLNNPDAWDNIIPVGLQWGNDPTLTPEAVKAGRKPEQSWINPDADQLLTDLGGTRADKTKRWGVGGRLNGPVDNFKSACASCHSVAERNLKENIQMLPKQGPTFMRWFRNLGPGESFNGGDKWSADYSLQLMTGYFNYQLWEKSAQGFTHKLKVIVPFSTARQEQKVLEANSRPLRAEKDEEDVD